MNWRVWAEIESILIQREIRPLLAVVPDNQDPGLQVNPPAGNFWERVRAWKDRGWTIALHGFQHRYVSRNAGLVAIRKKSEFAGLPAEEQQKKLRRGVEIFEREGITPRVWIAPGNTFDATTVALLPEFGIRIICDGYFRFPYASSVSLERGWTTWVPQQLFYFRPAPSGVWTVCYHHNEWTAAQVRKFRQDVDNYGANIVSLKDVLNRNPARVSQWSEWLCMHPRLSRFLIRAQLKLWSWYAGQKCGPPGDLDAVQLSR
jgi:peptidoglycan/xylan/chitin deacetylase (PgdA/CDA1 family)